MDKYEIEHRNEVLRAYFRGRDWDKNDEYLLKQKLIISSTELLPKYPYLIEDEWEVETGRANKGKGDLVFASEYACFAVVEVKWIDIENAGRTYSTRRTAKRQAVKEQAINYAATYAKRHLQKVEAFIFTNEYDQPCSLGIYNPEAKSIIQSSKDGVSMVRIN